MRTQRSREEESMWGSARLPGFYPRNWGAMEISEQRRDIICIWITLDAAWGRD